MEKVINVALAAYGMSGLVFHAPLISANPGFKLTKVLERKSEKSKERYPGIKVVKDFDVILNDKEIELVILNTPNATHYEMGKKVLEAGKHMVVEKPFTVTVKEGQELIDIAKKKNLVLSVFQNRRWDGDFMTVKKVIEEKLLGKLVEYEAHYDRFRNYIEANTWKEESGPGVGILYNLGSHMIDQAIDLFGMPKSVTADLRILRPGGKVDDSYDIFMDYGDKKVILKSSLLVREEGPRYSLHGTEGSFLKWGTDPQENALKLKRLTNEAACWGVEAEEWWGTLNTQINGVHFRGKIETVPGSYPAFYQNVHDVITGKAELIVKPGQSLDGIRIIEAVKESSSQKKTVRL